MISTNPATFLARRQPLHIHSPRQASTLVAQLESFASFAESNLSPSPGGGRRLRFGLIASLMFVMAFFYLATLIKSISIKNWWFIRFNKTGHLYPHVQLLIPLFAFCNGALVMCSIVLMDHDYNRYLRRFTMLSQLFSYDFLFFCAVTKIWAILASLPTVPIGLRTERDSDYPVNNSLSPFVFNCLVLLVYLSFPTITTPLSVLMTNDAGKLGEQVFQVLPLLRQLVHDPQAIDHAIQSRELSLVLNTIQGLLQSSMTRWRVMSGLYMVYTIILFGVFVFGSIQLISTLKKQLTILGQARRRFARLASVGVRSPGEDSHSKTLKPLKSSSYKSILNRPCPATLRSLRAWLWGEQEIVSDVWDPWNSFDSLSNENAELSQKYEVIQRYRRAIEYQLFFVSIIFLSFLTLTACLTVNAFGVPQRTSAITVVLITHEWAGWAWAVPGAALACLTACVAFVPEDPSSDERRPASTTTPIMTSFRRQMKFMKFPKVIPPESPRTSEESSRSAGMVNLRSYSFFLPTTPISPTHPLPAVKSSMMSDFVNNPRGQSQHSRLPMSSPPPALVQQRQQKRKMSLFSLLREEVDENKGISESSTECEEYENVSTAIERAPVVLPLVGFQQDLIDDKGFSDIDVIKSLRARHSECTIDLF